MQYVSDAYSKILGRMETPGFQFWSNLLQTSPTVDTLRNIGSSFFLSDEFSQKNYSKPEKLTALYRFALNREADLGGFWHYWQSLENGQSFASVVSQFFNSAEFNANVSKFLSLTYDFNPSLKPLAYGKPGEGLRFADTISLQNYLNTATGIVELAQSQTIEVKSLLYIPEGVTLKTYGSPDPSEYLKQVRFWRSSHYTDGATVVVSGGLSNVWVDGKRDTEINPNFKPQNIAVGSYLGSNIEIIDNRIENTLGFTALAISVGATEDSTAVVRGNFIDVSSSTHHKNWSDGISVSHKRALIKNNVGLNATDVQIVLFAADVYGTQSQDSIVINNRFYQTTRSAFGGLILDGVFGNSTEPAKAYLSQFSDNYMFTSKQTYLNIGISVGTRAWYGGLGSQNVIGGTIYGNYSDAPLRVATGIVVSGALEVSLGENLLQLEYAPESNRFLPRASVVASVSSGFASFKSVSVPWLDIDINGEILKGL